MIVVFPDHTHLLFAQKCGKMRCPKIKLMLFDDSDYCHKDSIAILKKVCTKVLFATSLVLLGSTKPTSYEENQVS